MPGEISVRLSKIVLISTCLLAVSACETTISDIKASPNSLAFESRKARLDLADCLTERLDAIRYGLRGTNAPPNRRDMRSRSEIFLKNFQAYTYLFEIADDAEGSRISGWSTTAGVDSNEPGPFIETLRKLAAGCAAP